MCLHENWWKELITRKCSVCLTIHALLDRSFCASSPWCLYNEVISDSEMNWAIKPSKGWLPRYMTICESFRRYLHAFGINWAMCLMLSLGDSDVFLLDSVQSNLLKLHWDYLQCWKWVTGLLCYFSQSRLCSLFLYCSISLLNDLFKPLRCGIVLPTF